METSFLAPSFHLLAPPVSPPRVIGIIMIKPRATFFHSLISRLGKSHSSSFVPCQRGSKFLVFFRGHKLPPLYILPLSSWTLLESWSNRKLQSFHGHQSEVGRRERITRFLFRLIFCLWPTCDDHTRRNWRATNLCVCVRARTYENWQFRGDKFSWEESHSKPSWNLRNDL